MLVVDDSRLQRHLLRSLLERTGFEVAEADSGDAGLAFCRENPPDLVISDWMMPGLSGLEFCLALRRLDLPRYVYFILVTSKSEKADIAQGLDVGADDFLTKPVSGDELRARVSAGERIVRMERELSEKNRLLTDTLDEMRRLHEAINNDLIEARKLQQSLIRDRHREFGNSQISLLLRPSGHVGGDLVGFFPINARRVGAFAIDVAGHGIASALMAARLAGYLSGTSPEQNLALVQSDLGIYDARPPAEFAAQLNRIVIEEMQTDSYFTMAYADIDLVSGAVEMVQAGHPHPAVLRADGRAEFIGQGGLPLGMFPDAAFEGFGTRLLPGDKLFLMSDGIIEAEGRSLGQLGEAGLSQILARKPDLGGPDFLEWLYWEISAFTGEDLGDDISGVLFEFAGPKDA
ncbi:MAG: PP2C family protein-serine/threonine phosphatase [Paracoccaceae bacterium]